MKIVMLTLGSFPHEGGVSSHITEMKKALNAMGHEVMVISDNTHNKLRKIVKILILPIRTISKSHYIYSAHKLMAWFSARVCSGIKCTDIIIANEPATATGITRNKKLRNIPKFLTMHSYFGIESKIDGKKVSDKLYKKILAYENECLKSINGIVCVDERIKEHVMQVLKKENIHALDNKVKAVSNFTDTDRFKPVDKAVKKSLRKKYNINENRIICLCARRLVEKNGVEYAVRAMEYLPDEFLLLIIGNGPEQDKIKELIKNKSLSEKILLLGGVSNENIDEFYKLSDISIVPSITVLGLQEATSITAIESMACGIPTVVSEIGGLRQLVVDGETGFFTEEKDFCGIAESISGLCKNPELYKKISIKCRKYIEENHSAYAAAKEYLKIYEDFLK